MNKIIDNENLVLLDQVRKSLSKTDLAKFAVGYFFISGFKEIYKDIENIGELRLLIGNSTDQKTCEQLAEANLAPNLPDYELRQAKFRNDLVKQKVISNTESDLVERVSRLHQTDENIKFMESLKNLIQDGKLNIKIYTKGRLHAKCYLMFFKKENGQKGEVIVGSSNLSLGGLKHNSELNVILPENYINDIDEWFDKLWSESPNFNENIINIIENSWVEYHPTPYELYLKIIYEIVKDKLFESEEEEEDLENIPNLYNYQKDAVIQAKSILEKYNGVFISDVVGLGKTYIGSRILYDLTLKYNKKALIICPPGMLEYWREILDDFGVRSEVQSNSYDNLQKIVENKRLMKREYILIDESHRFRNSDSKSYRLISDICFGKKIILVTATPQNLSPEDIKNQLKLFHPHNWTDIPIDPQFIDDFFILVKNGKRKIEDLLRHILIRRTRKCIENHYKEDMKRADVKFPERKPPKRINYSIEKVYGTRKVYEEIENMLAKLNYARYDIFHYSKSEFRDRPDFKQLKTAYENLRGLMKILFFKELESSIYSFRISIEKLINSHNNFLQLYEMGIIQTKQEGDDLIDYLTSSADATIDEYFSDTNKNKFTIDQFEDQLKEKIKADLHILKNIYDLVKIVNPAKDDKLLELKKQIKNILKYEKKVLIFTQFTTTAKYIHENIKSEFINVGMASGDSKDIVRISQRFSPNSFKDIKIEENEKINILISTDVLSEGANLQDCNTVINYDLHWNPVRLIQRLGRIDRVSTKHDFINNYNFFPEIEVEARLGLRERVEKRIRDIQRTLGEDAKYLSKDEKLNEKRFYQIYTGDQKVYEEEDLIESLGDNELMLILRELKEKEPVLYEKIVKLQKRLHTAKRSNKKGIAVFCKAGEMQSFYLTNFKGDVLTTNRDEILSLLKCKQDEPSVAFPKNFNNIVDVIQGKFENEIKNRVFEIESKESDPAMKFVFRDIKILRRGTTKDLKIRLEKINRFIAGRLIITENAKRELRKLHRELDTSLKEEYTKHLEEILFNKNNTREIETANIEKKKQEIYTEVIASEGLV